MIFALAHPVLPIIEESSQHELEVAPDELPQGLNHVRSGWLSYSCAWQLLTHAISPPALTTWLARERTLIKA